MRKKNLFTFLVATALVSVVAVQVEAQQDGQRQRQGQGQRRGGFQGRGGFPGGRGGGGVAGLLGIEEVQKEIELIPEQLADIEKMREELRGQRDQGGGNRERPNFQDLSDEERQKLIAEFTARRREQAKKEEEKLAEILLPHQMDRVKEIALQQQGTRALVSDAVVEKLGISADKKAELAKLLEENQRKMGEQMRALFQRGDDGERPDREALSAKMRELREDMEKGALALLTSSQQEEFAKMKGEPFDMPRRSFGGRGGQGGGQRRRPGGEDRPKRPEA